MPKYTYTGGNDFYLSAGERKLSDGDEVELDEPPEAFSERFEEVEESDDDEQEVDASETEDVYTSDDIVEVEWGGENPPDSSSGVTEVAPFDPGQLTVGELESELDDRDLSDEELDALEVAEVQAEDRSTAIEAINDARE